MAKRKGPSTSRPRARDKAAKEGSDAKRAFENECAQLGRDISALEAKQGKLEEQLGPLRREEEQVQQSLLAKIKRLEEVKNAQRLGKLPPEVWEKILGELGENDLFPLALSCRYFRQKQKELVARTRQRVRAPWDEDSRLSLRTYLHRRLWDDQPVSVDYVRFYSKENVSAVRHGCNMVDAVRGSRLKDSFVRGLAAFHGHLPLLQELLKPSNNLPAGITNAAGESSFSQSLCLLCRDF